VFACHIGREGDCPAVDLGAVTTAGIADDVHPNNRGYTKMGKAFTIGVLRAATQDWISAPQAQTTCSGEPIPNGRVLQFADVNGDRRDDYPAVDPRDGSVHRASSADRALDSGGTGQKYDASHAGVDLWPRGRRGQALGQVDVAGDVLGAVHGDRDLLGELGAVQLLAAGALLYPQLPR
jgi:hypothetical protein